MLPFVFTNSTITSDAPEGLIVPAPLVIPVVFTNYTINQDAPEGLIVPAPLVLPVVFTNSTINQGCSGRINSSCSIGVIRRVHNSINN